MEKFKKKIRERSTWAGLSALVALVGHAVVTGSFDFMQAVGVLQSFGLVALNEA